MQRIGRILKAFLAERLTGAEERMAELVDSCRELLGSAAAHVRVRDVRGSTLVLEVDHPGWGQLVTLRQAEILRSLGERFPEMGLSRLRVVSSPGAAPERRGHGSRNPEGARRKAAAGGGADAAIDEALGGVRDDELKRALRSLYEKANGSSKGE